MQTMNRLQTRLDLFFAGRADGKVEHILTERDKGWVNIHDDLYFLQKSERFLWASERSGYMHLYLYDLEGKLLGPVTSGEWAIRSAAGAVSWLRQAVHSIDEEGGWVYFTSIRESSIEKQLYRVRLDGSGLERLTKESGTPGIGFSENGRFYFNQHSNASTPPSLSLHARDGRRLELVAPSRPGIFSRLGMRHPEHFSIKTDDGFRMPAELLKPAGFSPGRRYPVIMHVYGGPAAPMVKDAWPSRTYFDQVLLNHGYVVFRCDNRSATARSKALENGILHDAWGSGELADLLEAIGWLKSQPWVDPDRVGIWGWSGGGYFT
ncbi:MAG: DPP IV N-terminal domain-containing protein, partial [Planctomycetes bacterium]|nr:DPP IV N-terminal domain-containing protein [Planctomycetota bacterium]